MDPDEESPFSRFGRTFWAALTYITNSLVRFLRTETATADVNAHSTNEDVARETVTQNRRSEHPEGGVAETEKCMIPWQNTEVITDQHEEEAPVYSVLYSKVRLRKTDLNRENATPEGFEKTDDAKQNASAEDAQKQSQHSSVSEENYRETMCTTAMHKELVNMSYNEAETLIKEADPAPFRTKPNSVDAGDSSATRNSWKVEESAPHGSRSAVSEVRGQVEKMLVQEVIHVNDPKEEEAQHSSADHREQDKESLHFTVTDQIQPEPFASHTNQEEPVSDATLNDQDISQSTDTTFMDQEEEIYSLTHRLVEAVVMSSVEFVKGELKAQEAHEEDHAQTSVTNLTCKDQVDSAHDLVEKQQPISNRPNESTTVWYDEEAEEGTELFENEDVAEQEVVSNIYQTRHEEEEQSQLQATEDHINDKQIYTKDKDLVKEGGRVTASDSDDDTTVEITEHTFQEGHCRQDEEHRSIEDAELMAQDSPITADPMTVAETAQATSNVIKEDLPQVEQCSQEMNGNAEEMIDDAIEVTDTSQDPGVEEPVEQKAEHLREDRMEEDRDEFEGLRPAQESEDEGVSIDVDDPDVQEADEGWHSEEGETEVTDSLTSPITEPSVVLLYGSEIPESGTDALLQREDIELTNTEPDISHNHRPKATDCDMQLKSRMATEESKTAAGSGCTGRELTLEREILQVLSETSEIKPEQEEPAQPKIKSQLSNESKSLDDSGSDLKMQITATKVTDTSDQEESADSDIKLTIDTLMDSELVDMTSGELITSKADVIEVTEEQVEDLEREASEASRSTDPQINMESDPLQSQCGSEAVKWTSLSPSDCFKELEDDKVDSSVSFDKDTSQEDGCAIETSSTEGVITDSENSLHPQQVMTSGEESVEPPQMQDDPDKLQPDSEIPNPAAESGEGQESEREYGEEIAEGDDKPQVLELCETASISSDEDNKNGETWEESKATEHEPTWETTENESKTQGDETENECRSVMEDPTQRKEEIEFDRAERESDGITETNPENMDEELDEKVLKEYTREEHEEPDVEYISAMQVESEETSLDGRMWLKRKLENSIAEDEQLQCKQDIPGQLPAGGTSTQVSSLDFSIQKSRLAVKNPQIRPPKDPRTLLNLPSLEPSPRPVPQQECLTGHHDNKPLGGGGGYEVKLPSLGVGFPVLRKTSRGGNEEETSESSSSQEKFDTEKTQAENAVEESKPKWTPPKHAIGMGSPFMMAELKGKLKKPTTE